MNSLIKFVPAVLLAFSAVAAADDFPPFFPDPGQGSGGQPTTQPGGGQTGGTAVDTGTGIYIPQPPSGPQQPPVQNPPPQPLPQGSIVGKWGAYMGGASMEFVFNPDGTGMVINNGQQVNFFYGIQGNTLILCDDRNCSTGANQFMFSLNGNVLYLNVNGQNIAYQRVGGAGPVPLTQAGLSGSYTCQIPNNPQMVVTHEFAGNVYRVYLSQGAMQKTLFEVGTYTLNGSQFNYTVQQSPNQQTVGTSGTNMIQFTGNGYVMTINGTPINCVKAF
ncbi:DUF5640 domain-containing protein [Succinimonas amylolytica]|jgi:hypothetical protein|uniref:DUF5640 domain-containing protein n=1 Tax=Succinimonas amylolytica TaxID=83769 RepID=UPI0012FB8C44|nr:DUF5640 domain-containing protein [Succinimonas amylolytica]